MKKSLDFAKAFTFAWNEFCNNFFNIITITLCWFGLVAICQFILLSTTSLEFSLFRLPVLKLNTLSTGYVILHFIIPTLLFGILEYLFTRLAFMSYRKDVVLPLSLTVGIKFALIQLLRRIAAIIGMLMFLFPGIYLSIRYFFPGYTIIDKTTLNMKDDLKYNFQLTSNREPELLNISATTYFILDLPFFLFTLLFLHTSYSGSWIHALALPFLCFLYVHIYEQLKAAEANKETVIPSSQNTELDISSTMENNTPKSLSSTQLSSLENTLPIILGIGLAYITTAPLFSGLIYYIGKAQSSIGFFTLVLAYLIHVIFYMLLIKILIKSFHRPKSLTFTIFSSLGITLLTFLSISLAFITSNPLFFGLNLLGGIAMGDLGTGLSSIAFSALGLAYLLYVIFYIVLIKTLTNSLLCILRKETLSPSIKSHALYGALCFLTSALLSASVIYKLV